MKIFIKSTLVLLCIGGIVWGYTREVPYFSNTFNIQYLFFRALFAGALVGAAIGWFFSKKMADKSDRVPMFAVCLVACMAVVPLKALFTNHFFAKNTPLSTKVIFQKEEPLITSRFGIPKNTVIKPDAYYVFFLRNGKTERIRSKTSSFRTVGMGQEIELPIKKGFWGFDFVDIP